MALRERRLLVFCAALITLVGNWVLAIEPAMTRIDHWEAELPRLRSQSSALDTVINEAALPEKPVLPAPSEIPARLTRSLDAMTPGAYALLDAEQSKGATSGDASVWRVRFEDAEADAVMAWLFQVPTEVGLIVSDVTLTQSAELLPPDTDIDVRALAGRVRGDVRLALPASLPSKDSP